jgi:hypothetical protein
METIDVEIVAFTLRARSMLVPHSSTALARGLDPGERVILHDTRLGHFSAIVADIAFEPNDTIYRLKVGVRLTPEEADERRRRAPAPAAPAAPEAIPAIPAIPATGTLTRQDLLDLLGQLRATDRNLPAGRHRRETRSDAAL